MTLIDVAGAVPLTGLAEFLLFRVGKEFFAMPLANAEEAVEALERHSLPGMPRDMAGVAQYRGARLPVYGAEQVFGIARVGGSDEVTLVVRGRGGRVGVIVDDVEDVILVDLASLRPVPGPASAEPVVSGVLPRGGELVAMCDPDALVRTCLGARA
jgi:purine-binding chemotaxis protein CheW